MVNVLFKQKVYEHGVTFKKWFWKWTAEHRRQRFLEGRWKGNGGQGYQPHASHQARAPQPSITNPDSGLWWSTAGAEPRPPSPPSLPQPVNNFIVAEFEDSGQRPPSSTSMWTHRYVAVGDGSLTELASMLDALAVPVELPIHVPAEDETSSHNVEDNEQTTSEQGAPRAAFIEDAQVGYTCDDCNKHAFEESVPKDKLDFEMMD